MNVNKYRYIDIGRYRYVDAVIDIGRYMKCTCYSLIGVAIDTSSMCSCSGNSCSFNTNSQGEICR